jgi:hypothetical protein
MLRRDVQTMQLPRDPAKPGHVGMQLPQPPDRGLIRLAIQHHHHIDVAAGRTEVTGDQRPIDVDADQIPPPHKSIPETLEDQADVARKLHRVLSLRRASANYAGSRPGPLTV